MPLPIAVAGFFSAAFFASRLSAILTFFAGLMGAVAAFFAQWATRKLAVFLGVVTITVASTLVVFAAISSMIAGITVVVPPCIVQGFNMILPANFIPCLSTIFAARAMAWVYSWKVNFIAMLSRA